MWLAIMRTTACRLARWWTMHSNVVGRDDPGPFLVYHNKTTTAQSLQSSEYLELVIICFLWRMLRASTLVPMTLTLIILNIKDESAKVSLLLLHLLRTFLVAFVSMAAETASVPLTIRWRLRTFCQCNAVAPNRIISTATTRLSILTATDHHWC